VWLKKSVFKTTVINLHCRHLFIVCLALLSGSVFADVVQTLEKKQTAPLWELGAAGGVGYIADYPAAEQNHLQNVVVPYFIYRGERLRMFDEKGGVRGRLLNNERLEMDLSISGSLPADSADNDARRGMPDLDYLLEVGPRLDMTLSDPKQAHKLSLQLPLRMMVSTDLTRIDYQGVLLNPDLVWSDPQLFGSNFQFGASLGATFASEDFMDYFYQVDPEFVTTMRPSYNASGGYLGSRIKVSLSKNIGKETRVLGVITTNYFGGSANEDSPLFGDDLNVGVGLAIVHTFWQSERLSGHRSEP
jgi:outer membrane scaffolding protein for murein synthesis (MipA/OmpV family)